MEDLIGSLLYSFIGWVYLWIRYRNKEKVQTVLKEKYNDSFYDAGATKVLHFVGVLFITVLVVVLIAVIYKVIPPLWGG